MEVRCNGGAAGRGERVGLVGAGSEQGGDRVSIQRAALWSAFSAAVLWRQPRKIPDQSRP
jgi:hypothetical protein